MESTVTNIDHTLRAYTSLYTYQLGLMHFQLRLHESKLNGLRRRFHQRETRLLISFSWGQTYL